jgi:hypothetical protein
MISGRIKKSEGISGFSAESEFYIKKPGIKIVRFI